MAEITFTAAQSELINREGSFFVEACPGAGKTQSIVQRFIQRALIGRRRGIALLSFTNAAVDEAIRRCSGNPELLLAPNFVGTIDSFIIRFITGPIYREKYGRAATFKDSWDTVQGTSFRVKEVPNIIFRLGWFSFDPQLGASLELNQVAWDQRRFLKNLTKGQIRAATIEAANLYSEFTRNGIYESEGSRMLMRAFLADEAIAELVGEILVNRFAEIIVDEVQDCSDSDIELFSFVLDQGIDLVMVGDMEQAIFGFRGSSIDAIQSLISRVQKGTRLDANFRSTPPICSLVNSMRSGTAKDHPARAWSSEVPGIQVVPVAGFDGVHRCLARIAQKFGVDSSDVVVLAHSGWFARKCAGAGQIPGVTNSRLVQLASAARNVMDHAANARRRRLEEQKFQAILRELTAPELLRVGDDEFFESVGLRPREFSDGCLRLIYRIDPSLVTPKEYKNELISAIKSLGWDTWLDLKKLRIPTGDQWPDKWSPSNTESLPWSTIHSFKGLEAPAVAVAIPYQGESSDKPINKWLRDEQDESRRVLYVGVSRGKILTMLVIHMEDFEKVVQCLKRDNVSFVRIDCSSEDHLE